MKDSAVKIINKLQQNGHKAVLAGGCVRDQVMGHIPKDYDIATDAYPEAVCRLFKRVFPSGIDHGTVTVMDGDEGFEVTTFRTDGVYMDGRRPSKVKWSSMEEDAYRRDLTINGMFYDPEIDSIIDYVGGMEDINNKIIRFIGSPEFRIEEDKLRMIRAIRFAAKYDFEFDPASWKAITSYAPEITVVSKERIRDEIGKILLLEGSRVGNGLQMLLDSGILKATFPELAKLDGCEQDPGWHPEGDAWVHTKMVVSEVEKTPIHVWGALFHDIGKPRVTMKIDGRIRSTTHDTVGAEMTEIIMRDYKFSSKLIEGVSAIVKGHMNIKFVSRMKKSAWKRLFAKPYFNETMEVSRADSMSGSGDVRWLDLINEKLSDWTPEQIKPEPLITGHDLIQMGFTPGAKFREILEFVETRQLDEKIRFRHEAINEVKMNFGAPQ